MTLAALTLSAVLACQSAGGLWEPIGEISGSLTDQVSGSFAGGGDCNGDGVGDFVITRLEPTRLQVYSGRNAALLWETLVPGVQPWIATYSLAWVADVNGDGRDDLAAGDPNNEELHLFSGADGTLLWTHANPSFGDLGLCVDAAGDLSGDGIADVLAYAPWTNHPSGFARGACIAFSGTDGSVVRIFYHEILWSLSTSGKRIASAGDVDGDGVDDVLLGFVNAPGLDGSLLLSGATGSLIRTYSEQAEWFGASVANAGDLDGDAVPDQLIAAVGSGRVFAYSGATGHQLWSASCPTGLGSPWFGKGLVSCEDVDDDGIRDLLVGAPQFREVTAEQAGAVFLLAGRDGTVLAKLRGQPGTSIGNRVATLGDTTGDGVPEILYGGDAFTHGAGARGRVAVAAWHPGLSLSSETISGTLGGQIRFAVRWPASEAGLYYELLASRTGAGPSAWQGLQVPLTFDSLTNRFHAAPPRGFSRTHGHLDAQGDATIVLDLPPGVGLPWLGSTVWFSTVTVLGRAPRAATVSRTLTILP